MDQQQKSHMNIAVIGHVDSGKSTIIGHLLYKLGVIDQATFQKARYEDMQLGRSNLLYAFLLDKHKAERERGISIHGSFSFFESSNHNFTMIDTPGHKDFVKHMISTTSQADVAILVISAAPGEFEWSFGTDGSIREQVLVAFTLGIKQIVVCVNKMGYRGWGRDDRDQWSEARFNDIKTKLGSYLQKVGYDPEKIPFIPISGLNGENLFERINNPLLSHWYQGPCLLEALDTLETPKRSIERPFRMPIYDVYEVYGIGTVVTGTVQTGTLKVGMEVTFGHKNEFSAQAISLQVFKNNVTEAIPGDNIGINIKGFDLKDFKRGDIIGELIRDPPKIREEFTAKIMVLNHPNQINKGYAPVVYCHTAHVSCIFEELITKMTDKEERIEKNPEYLKTGDCALVRMKPMKPFCVETYEDYPALGRIIIRDSRIIIAVGVIKSVVQKDK